jgi:RNA polymerase sigma-70 factor (ECF subfamily)
MPMRAPTPELEAIYQAFQPRILRYMRRMVGESEAQDLTQEVFIKAQRGLADFRGEAQLSTWLYRIATNTALDRLRSTLFQQTEPACLSTEAEELSASEAADLPEAHKPPIEKALIRDEMNDCLRGYVDALPAEYRQVLMLSEWDELPDKDIAETLGVTLQTVKIRLHRARARLKSALRANCDAYWVEELPFKLK